MFELAQVGVRVSRYKWALTVISGFPLGLENLEKVGRHFPVREKSGNFEQTGKVRETAQNTGKLREFQKKNYLLFFNDI